MRSVDVFRKLAVIGKSAWYWLMLVLLGMGFESVALFYQHVLDELPCVMCIHVRILMLALILVSLAALFIRRFQWLNATAHLLTVLVAVLLLERSYQLLGTERGFTFGDCGMDLGLPSWLALDSWFPAVFQVQTSCGYTPELLFGISMAEALIVFSPLFLLLTLAMTLASFMDIDKY
jgi:disulfide bond formation protein DsbB